MPRENVLQAAFNRGVVSRLALARTDIKRVAMSAEQQNNWMPRVLGSMMLRPGLGYKDSTLGDNFARHIPFIFDLDDTALLEFSNQAIRARVDEEVISRTAVSTTIRGGDFSADVSNFAKLSDPGTTPTGNANGIAFSADGQLMAIAHATSPYVSIYSISGTTFTKLSDPSTLPPAEAFGVAFSPDGAFLAVGHNTSPRITIYSISGTGAAATFTKLSDPVSLPSGQPGGVAFSPDSSLLSVVHNTSPYCTVYSISGTIFTKLTGGDTSEFANSADLPASTGNGVAFNETGRFMAVAHTTSPFVSIYSINGTTFTKLSNPGTLPASTGNGVAFSRDGLHMAVAHETTPFVTIYSISGTTFTKLSNPSTLPDGNGKAVAFSSDNQFLAVAHATTQYLTLYRYVSGVWTKQSDPGTLPDGDSYGIAFSPNNRFLGVAHDTSAYATLYEAYQWLDMDGSGAASTYGGITGSFVQSNAWAVSSAFGAAFNGYTVRQVVDSGQLTRSGSKVKISFKGTTTDGNSISSCYIGLKASSGDAYDFASAPTQVTFNGGSAGFSVTSTTAVTSDEISFEIDETKSYVIAFRVTSGFNNWAATVNAGSNQVWAKSASNDASTVNATGYTNFSSTGEVLGISKIEVYETTGSATTGLSMVGTLFTEAKRIQAVSVLNADVNVEHGIRVIVAQGRTRFHIGSEQAGEDLVAETYLTKGTYSFSFTPTTNLFFVEIHSNTEYSTVITSCQIEGAGDMTLPTDYAEADLGLIRWAQSGDIVYLASAKDGASTENTYEPMKIERRGERSWSIVAYEPEDGPFRDENTTNITLTPSAISGDITLTASRDLFRDGHVGALFRIASVGQTVSGSFTGANQFTASEIRVTGVGTTRAFTITRSGTWSATVTLQRSLAEPGNWTDVATFTSNGSASYNDELDNQIVYYRIGIKTGDYTSGTAVITLAYSSGSLTGVCRITAVSSTTSASAIVLKQFGGVTASDAWSEGAWSEHRGYPSAVTLFESRLNWAGKDKVWGSEVDAFESFDPDIEGDSAPYSRSIGEGPVDKFSWLLSLQRLVLGAQMAEFSAKSSNFDEPLTPSNFNLKASSTQGSANVPAVKIDNTGIFADRSETRVFQLTYSVDTYDYTASDLTVLCPELCEAGVTRIAVQRRPDTRVHAVLGDGTAAVMILEPAEEVTCWVTVETDGEIEDVVILPGTPEDSVYYVVQRTINGATKRYLEKWAMESECRGGTLNKQADSFVTFTNSPASATVTGLSHLEGESVVVWADGLCLKDAAGDIKTFTVSSGQISLTNEGSAYLATTGIVGLSYEARFKSTKLAYAAGGGTALARRKRLIGLGLVMADTHARGVKVGDNFDLMDDLPSVEQGADVDTDSVWDDYEMDLFGINSKWTVDSRLCLKAQAPRPATMLGAVMAIETNG
jgi:6-phosphogluconolactonase (cycloisomerase 2 family)